MKLSRELARRLAELDGRPVNYDPADLDLTDPPRGWNVDDRFQPLPAEAPGPPVPGGSWEIAGRLIRGYEFADPSLVRAFYDVNAPMEGRNMLLALRALNLVQVYVGVRVNAVYDHTRTAEGREVRVFGWNYRTLEGHVEQGQMDWEVWKWLDSGEVAFHVHAVSRPAAIRNPVIRIGFWLLRGHEREVFLGSTSRRMRAFTELGLRDDGGAEQIRAASDNLTARRLAPQDPAHDRLAGQIDGRAHER
ncbi:MAG: DUF1990 domain-containing protein [Candidatus Dormibacteraeota bacterium]|nr:DUF1990 domain-containing protein [Candidatus Dormibacteraeota bacterium]